MLKENLINKGNVVISDDVISTIIKTAALEVEGVAEIASNISKFKEVLNKKEFKGISFNNNEDGLSVSISLALYYGQNIIELSKRVQSKVKEAIENMTGASCANVDINVMDIIIKDSVVVKE